MYQAILVNERDGIESARSVERPEGTELISILVLDSVFAGDGEPSLVEEREGLRLEVITSLGERNIIENKGNVWGHTVRVGEPDPRTGKPMGFVVVKGTYQGKALVPKNPISPFLSFSAIASIPDARIEFTLPPTPGEIVKHFDGYDPQSRGLHWSRDIPPYFKPWSTKPKGVNDSVENLYEGLPISNKAPDRLPDLWSEGNHPDARRLYWVVVEKTRSYIHAEWFNSKGQHINSKTWIIRNWANESSFEGSPRFEGTVTVREVSATFEDGVKVRALPDVEEETWYGWEEGTAGAQPRP